MIVGLGIDVVGVERFGRTLERTPALRTRLFTAAERDLPLESLAARFAAKEAVAKALGAPMGMRWHDCEVVADPEGPVDHRCLHQGIECCAVPREGWSPTSLPRPPSCRTCPPLVNWMSTG